MRRFAFLFLTLCATIVACEGARNNSSWSKREQGKEIVPSLHKEVPHDVATSDSDSAATDSTAAESSEAKH